MELLNGKANELFWEWFFKPETLKRHKLSAMLRFSNEACVKVYVYSLPEICQNALIIEWLDSIGYYIQDCGVNVVDFKISFDAELMKEGKLIYISDIFFASRQQATTEAIKKAVELINESNGK